MKLRGRRTEGRESEPERREGEPDRTGHRTADRSRVGQAPPLPPELARSHPRLVHLTRAGRWASATVAALLVGSLAAGIALAQAAQRDRLRLDRMQREGVRVEAEVLERGRVRGEGHRFFVTYRFTAEGRPYRGRAVFRERSLPAAEMGGPLTVAYLPSSPDESWLPGREPRGVPIWVAPVAALALFALAAVPAHSLRKQRRLLTEGRPALARVTRTERVTYHRSHGHHTVHRVHYEFRILSGATRTGRFEMPRDPPAVGTAVWIVYDREDAGRQARYPFTLVRA